MKKINVFAVCKNDRFVRALECFLEGKGVCIVAICRNALHANDAYLACKPEADIILIDAYWHDYYVIHSNLIIELVNVKSQKPRVIIMTNMYESHIIKKLKDLGAQGYFYKALGDLDAILYCIRTVYEGTEYFQDCR